MVEVVDRGFAREAHMPGIGLPSVRGYVDGSGRVRQYELDVPAARVFLTPVEARAVYECLRSLGVADAAERV